MLKPTEMIAVFSLFWTHLLQKMNRNRIILRNSFFSSIFKVYPDQIPKCIFILFIKVFLKIKQSHKRDLALCIFASYVCNV